MNIFFDEEAQKVLKEAKKEMYELKHPYVGSEHLFLAILKNVNLEITIFLNKQGICYNNFKKELIDIVGVGSKNNEWFLFTPLLKRIINNATYSSKDDDKIVTPYDLLVSILQEGDGVANRILLGMKVDLECLYEKFINNSNFSMVGGKKLLLDEFAINMNKEYLNNKYDPVIGRDDKIAQIIQILLRKNKNNPVLVGEAGVGKTAIVEELARRINLGDVPIKLKDKIIYNVAMSSLISGTKYRGEFEERINKIIQEVIANPNIILFIDEIHTLVGAGGAEGAIDASNILKPYLARGDIKVIGATTNYEYDKYIAIDKALDRRFQRVIVEEASSDEVREIIYNLVNIYEKFHGVILKDSILDLIINLSNKFIVRGREPDKTIDLLDEVCCFSSIHNNVINKQLREVEKEMLELEGEKNEEILKHNFDKAMNLRKREKLLQNKYNDILIKNNRNKKVYVKETDVYHVFYNKTGIPLSDIFINRISGVDSKLKKKIIGQDNAIKELIDFFRESIYLNKNGNNNCLLVGKKGVGKTFLIEEAVSLIFNKNNLVKIDMSDYQESVSLNKIVGSVPGYVGYNDRNSFLDKISDRNFCVILIRNIDLAAPRVLNYFLKGITDGYFINNRGDQISVKNFLFFMTINVRDLGLGFNSSNIDNELLKKFSVVIKLRDLDIKDLNKYLATKVIDDLDLKKINTDVVNKICLESNFLEEGFSKVDDFIYKYIFF